METFGGLELEIVPRDPVSLGDHPSVAILQCELFLQETGGRAVLGMDLQSDDAGIQGEQACNGGDASPEVDAGILPGRMIGLLGGMRGQACVREGAGEETATHGRSSSVRKDPWVVEAGLMTARRLPRRRSPRRRSDPRRGRSSWSSAIDGGG
jgi:hypothetical protein